MGVAAGLVGAAFFAALEFVQRLLLEDLGGYLPLRAHGETFLPELPTVGRFRPWLLVLLPAVGALGERHHLASSRPRRAAAAATR